MGDNTKIEWTDTTWNPIRGCSRKSAGCGGPHGQGGCYAEKIAARFSGPGQPFEGLAHRVGGEARWTGKVILVEDKLTEPLRWKRPRRIFVNSVSDLFHENLPDEAIDKVFAVMALAPQHTFQVLTKRADRMRAYLTDQNMRGRVISHMQTMFGPGWSKWFYEDIRDFAENGSFPAENIWLGVSVEDQAAADERIPELLATPAAVRFLSCEPLIGPVDLSSIDISGDEEVLPLGAKWLDRLEDGEVECPRIDWVIAGGESGTGARPAHPDWFRSLRDQCAAAGVPFFFKQWGEWAPDEESGRPTRTRKAAFLLSDGGWNFEDITASTSDGMHIDDVPDLWRCSKKTAGRLLDGIEHNGMPGGASC